MNERLPRLTNPVGEFCPWPRKPNRRERAAIRRARRADGDTATFVPELIATHGTVPSSAEGWVAQRPTQDASLYVTAIRSVRFDDGEVRRYYLMRVRPAIVQAKQELARKKLAEIRRENREAEKREAKEHRKRMRLLFGR